MGDDAMAEGVEFIDREPGFAPWRAFKGARFHNTPIDAFEDWWNHVHGPGARNLNPWVWRIEFERMVGE